MSRSYGREHRTKLDTASFIDRKAKARRQGGLHVAQKPPFAEKGAGLMRNSAVTQYARTASVRRVYGVYTWLEVERTRSYAHAHNAQPTPPWLRRVDWKPPFKTLPKPLRPAFPAKANIALYSIGLSFFYLT